MLVMLMLSVILAVGAFLFLRRIYVKRGASAVVLDEHPRTEEQIEQAIRDDMAPQRRPYGDGGKYIDSGGKRYLADKNGTLHRVVITEQGVPLLVKPWNKARRRAEKRKRSRARAFETLSQRNAASPMDAGHAQC